MTEKLWKCVTVSCECSKDHHRLTLSLRICNLQCDSIFGSNTLRTLVCFFFSLVCFVHIEKTSNNVYAPTDRFSNVNIDFIQIEENNSNASEPPAKSKPIHFFFPKLRAMHCVLFFFLNERFVVVAVVVAQGDSNSNSYILRREKKIGSQISWSIKSK